MKIVWVNGIFDRLHLGHVWFLVEARALGDLLVVGINTDASARARKGPGRPTQTLEERERALLTLACVGLVVPFAELTPCQALNLIRPQILVKSAEYSPGRKPCPEVFVVESYGGQVVYLPRAVDCSTSALLGTPTADNSSSARHHDSHVAPGSTLRG
jgi:rfaE bifunctional protein nucleotidyltransferase chain/domain